MLRLDFRTKTFLAALAVAATALLLATATITAQLRRDERASIEKRLTDEARTIAELLAHTPEQDDRTLDDEADTLAGLIGVRVTFIASDGTVLGESTLDGQPLADIDNHLQRPEVQQALRSGVGVIERFSTTTGEQMVYAAVTARHVRVAFVRVAEPMRAVADQVARVGSPALLAFGLAIPVAVVLAWLSSVVISRRVREIARVASRYHAGDFTSRASDFGEDEVGSVAKALDAVVQELRVRLDELARDRARMEAILTGMNEGVVVVDPTGRVQLVNRAAQDLLRVEASATERPYIEVIRHPDITSRLAAALAGSAPDACELTLTGGAGRTVIARAAPVGSGGAVLVVHDITDLRRADQARRDFVANISHELRTPLTSIRGYLEALSDEGTGSDERKRFIEVIARQSLRMERLVTDLLRLARLDAKQEPLTLAACSIDPLFRAVLSDLEPMVQAKQQRVESAIADDAQVVQADAAKLHDILRNLVENAVNYSPELSLIRVSSQARPDGIAIVVEDTGPGLPPQDITRVFERFYRVDKSRGRPGGTGLGLAIVKHLVELHGGRVWAENRPEGGAVFTVLLARPDRASS